MELTWDYSQIAEDYAQRPEYAPEAVAAILEFANFTAKSTICDIGAGAGRLTLLLARHGIPVTAIEPSPEMRAIGERRCVVFDRVIWKEATGEQTGCDDQEFSLVTYGSSFHTVQRQAALAEANRILKPLGWFACLWNHRDLNDPLQALVDEYIVNTIPGFSSGVRREDQSQILQDCGYFSKVQRLNYPVRHTQTIDEAMVHWRSHLTLMRQAGDRLPQVLTGIERILRRSKQDKIVVPYNTRVWLARKND